jgi:hypothetical protein
VDGVRRLRHGAAQEWIRNSEARQVRGGRLFTFTNNRTEEVTLDPELHMTLRDAQGREFVPTRLDIFLEPVNPGIS